MGRALAVFGESVHVIDLDGGAVTLSPASRWEDQRAGLRPTSWRYAVELPLPNGRGREAEHRRRRRGTSEVPYQTRQNALGKASVPARPWHPRPQALAGWIEKRLAEEASATSGYRAHRPGWCRSDGNVTGLASSISRRWLASSVRHRDDGGAPGGRAPGSGT